MKARIHLLLISLVLPLLVSAQVKIGYLSFGDVCRQMPQYKLAQQSLTTLKEKYDREAQRTEDDFQRKYTEFLQGQKDFPANILQKRQAELQDLLEKGKKFRSECQQLLTQAEATYMQGVKDSLRAAIRDVGAQHGYAVILNSDGEALPYVDATIGEDVTQLVLVRLGIAREPESAATDHDN